MNAAHASRLASCLLAASMLSLLAPLRAAEGLYGTGVGARSTGMGGIDVATPASALGALGANPAALSLITSPEADAGFEGASPYGRFTSKSGDGGTLSSKVSGDSPMLTVV